MGERVNDGRGAFVSPDPGHFSRACENLAMAGTKNAPCHLDWLGSISGDDVKCGMSLFVALVHTPRVYLQFLHFSSLHKNLNSKLQLRSGKQETKSKSIEGPLRNFTFLIFYIPRWVPQRYIRISLLCSILSFRTWFGRSVLGSQIHTWRWWRKCAETMFTWR